MPSYYVKTGLAGYGPDLDPEDEPCELESLDYLLHDELSRAADSAEELAHALASEGDYETAWNEHERAGALEILSMNLSPSRKSAPLYQGNAPLWHETVKRIVEESFPVDVSPNTRLYVWEHEGEGEHSV